MPSKLSERDWTVDTEILEPVPLSVSTPESSSYPRLGLRKTGQRQASTFQTVVLENDWVEATVVPDLGGRIASLTDRRTGTEVWPLPPRLVPSDAPDGRGLWLPVGLQLQVSETFAGSLGPVDFSLHEPAHDEASGGVVVASLHPGGLDWHVCYSIPPGAAEILVEVRVHNRGLGVCPAPCTLRVPSGRSLVALAGEALTVYDPELRAGVALSTDAVAAVTAEPSGTVALLLRPGGLSILGPRETRSWTLYLTPISGLASLDWFESGVAVSQRSGPLSLLSSRGLAGSRVFVMPSGGAALESAADLVPHSAFEADLGAPVEGIVVKDASGVEVVRTGTLRPVDGSAVLAGQLGSTLEVALASAYREGWRPFEDEHEPRSVEEAFFFDASHNRAPGRAPFGCEAAAAVLLAEERLRQREFKAAIADLDRSLLTNSEDQLAWWLKAVAERHTGVEQTERTSFLNARFLAPLDPVLRAEAFLSTPIAEGPGPSPLVRPLAHDPDSLLDVLCLLLECGLRQDAARLTDEALKHREAPLVRYVHAWSLLRGSRMEAEAAEQVRRAGLSPVEPPFPHRVCEVKAILDLAQRFPEDRRLGEWKAVVGAFVLNQG